MSTVITQGWAYTKLTQMTIAVPVSLTGDYVFPTVEDNKLKNLKEANGEVYFEEHGIKFKLLPLDSEIDFPNVVAPEELAKKEFSSGLLFLASVNSSSFLPNIMFGETYAYVTDGQSMVAYMNSDFNGFRIHKDIVKTAAKYGSDFSVAHDPENMLLYGESPSNYFVATCEENLDNSIHDLIIEFEKVATTVLPDNFYQTLYNIMRINTDLLLEFSNTGIKFTAENPAIIASASIEGDFPELTIKIPAYLSKCLPDLACTAELVENHIKLTSEFITMIIGE